MKRWFLPLLLCCMVYASQAQDTSLRSPANQRLNFARTYFEVGMTGYNSFTGIRSTNITSQSVEHSASLQPYVSWGGFHFWGHAEFYIVVPIEPLTLKRSDDSDFELSHSVVTGIRLLPWAFKEQKLRPYIGASWSGLDFKQSFSGAEEEPTMSKNFNLVTDAGLLYGHKNFALRLGVIYFPDTSWEYPISQTAFEQILTPEFAIHMGLIYSFDSSENEKPARVERWNEFPAFSSSGSHAAHRGDFFIGLGPSTSFSLSSSTYTQEVLPFLNDQVSSSGYFDAAIGYQFNKAGMFAALSFRNPEYQTEGFGVAQTIQKTSLAIEVTKFLFDYSGFTPYVGLNVAYDHIRYEEVASARFHGETFHRVEPGLTLGWDILPGKTEEYLILRTNLRWYPFSSFEIEGKPFDFSQLEYNLIQAVFYPGRLLRARRK